ncbi:MAG: sugar transport system ATP-binding protein [Microbacteriaceae bacterium]|nr:sugar transport system ATP-binding protein [Microbacteriaceae bacterium]
MTTASAPLIELSNATKHYPGVLALDDVDFRMSVGEVRALLGKNGAGKSTLIKVLGGTERLNSGTLRVAGREVNFKNPKDAIEYGIATVHQELASVPEMSVAENISLGRWTTRPVTGIAWKEVSTVAKAALAHVGVELPLDARLSTLSLAQAQLVEIARALSLGAKLLILDEPTSSLAVHEVDLLLQVVKRLSERGIGVIYISHRMDEIERLASSVTVMRDGRNVGDLSAGEATPQRVVNLMVGNADPGDPVEAIPTHAGDVALTVTGLTIPHRVIDASFEVREGEVVGLAGLLGSGRTEILRAIVGAQPGAAGAISLDGKPLRRRTIRSTRAAGIFLTPEDRRAEGAVVMLGVDENLVMASWNKVSSAGIIPRERMRETVTATIKKLSIKVPRRDVEIATLSGGNQQKVVIGKALNAAPRILLMDEPTRGVDVEAKAQIYTLIRRLAAGGIGVLVVSSETEELLEVCDRILVLRSGRIHENLPIHDVTRDSLFEHMIRRESDD